MNVLHMVGIFVLSIVVAGCGSTPKMYSKYTPDAPVKSSANCPPVFEKDAITKYGYPEEWKKNHQLREPPRVSLVYECEYVKPLIEWATSASNHESERGGCEPPTHTHFRCRSERGPSGKSREGAVVTAKISSKIEAAFVFGGLRACPRAAAERREVSGRIRENRVGKLEWEVTVKHECYV